MEVSRQKVKVAIGSTNRAKVRAVRTVIEKVWPDAQLMPVTAASGVGDMPMSSDECLEGARNRARAALDITGSDLAIGLEGGVHREQSQLMLLGWAVALSQDGDEGIGGGARLPLPPYISQRVLSGEELGPIMDELLEQKDVKQKGGAVGALTSGLILRSETFAVAVAYALAPFVAPRFYR